MKKNQDNHIEELTNINVGILLAAGTSSRFNHEIPKQLFEINGKSIISYSIEAMSDLDEIIIVTNKECRDKISGVVLINEVNCRLESIKTALDYIKDADNVIIHDAARPFITKTHIKNLLNKDYLYQQYYLKLVNGLAKIDGEVVDRNQYIELCTPQIINYSFFNFIFRNYMNLKIYHEVLSLAKLFNVKYNLIEGHHKHLRKITTIEDI